MATVTVSCKTPNGFSMEVDKKIVVINGWNSKEAFVVPCADGVKAALTSGVDAEFWKSWLATHKNHPLVTNGMVFAENTDDKARDATKERKSVKSGLEALNPNDKSNGVEKETK